MTRAEDSYEIRVWHDVVQETVAVGGRRGDDTQVKAASAVVIGNPLAGRWYDDLDPLIEPSAALGTALGRRALGLLGGRPAESYGKGGVAGVDGEQEHVVACVTTVFGDALREALGGGAAWISSATKTSGAGAQIDIPLAHKDELYVRSHYDAITVSLPGAPRPDELVIIAAVATGRRLHSRVGGLSAAEVNSRRAGEEHGS